MLGIIPAAGLGSRIQPLAFSKELLPVGSRRDGDLERPRAVSEYLVDRMTRAGADRVCFVVSPGKSDILEYYGAGFGSAPFCYTVQTEPRGLADAVFCALPFARDSEDVVIGLPDTVWFPENGLALLPDGELSFLLFPVDEPHLFDAVVVDADENVRAIHVKNPEPPTRWIWGAIKMPAATLEGLHRLFASRDRGDAYIGTLLNAYIAQGGRARGVRAGTDYVDVGTLNGYRRALALLANRAGAS